MRIRRCFGLLALLVGCASVVGCGPTHTGATGDPCDSASECDTGFCSNGICCEEACDTPCMACEEGTGECTAYVPEGREDLDASPVCADPDSCDGAGNCIGSGENGDACSQPDQCNSGICVDGVCCVTRCDQPCFSCSSVTGECTVYVPLGDQDPNSIPSCTSPYACDGQGHCMEMGTKRPGDPCIAGDECLSELCVDGVCCEDACSEPCMTCAPSGSCDNYVAAGDPDPNGMPPCNIHYACDGAGECKKKNGEVCTTFDECLSGFCVDGVCCEDACDTSCMTCANDDGTCTSFMPAGMPDVNASPPCHLSYACDGFGACKATAGNSCISAADCATGHCVDDTCCMTACDSPCLSCDNAQGTCTSFVGSWVEDVNSNPPCTAPYYCDGDGACCDLYGEQAQALPVDIIFVIDNSGSMSQEIASVENNINASFATIIANSGLDYRVIMVTDRGTGTYQICVDPPLGGAACANNPPIFYHHDVTVGSHNSWCLTISQFPSYSGWLRPNAFKIFVEITDDGVSCTQGTNYYDADTAAGGTTAAALFDADLLALSPTQFGTALERNYRWYSIVCLAAKNPATDPWYYTDPITTSTCSSTNCPDPGTGYQALSITTEGLRFPLCEFAHYDVIFNAIANDVVNSLACQYMVPPNVDPGRGSLRFTPSVGPVEEWPNVTDLAACTGDQWYYDNNTTPTMMVLCPGACDKAKADHDATIEVLRCEGDF